MSERFGKTAGQLSPWFLREWRKHRGLTQEELAERIDSTKATISRMETGAAPYSQPFLEACADALDCHPADLITSPPAEAGPREVVIRSIKSMPEIDFQKLKALIQVVEIE